MTSSPGYRSRSKPRYIFPPLPRQQVATSRRYHAPELYAGLVRFRLVPACQMSAPGERRRAMSRFLVIVNASDPEIFNSIENSNGQVVSVHDPYVLVVD